MALNISWPCTAARVIQSEFPQSARIYMRPSHSAFHHISFSVVPTFAHKRAHTHPSIHTHIHSIKLEGAEGQPASFMKVSANNRGNQCEMKSFPLLNGPTSKWVPAVQVVCERFVHVSVTEDNSKPIRTMTIRQLDYSEAVFTPSF